MLHVQNQFGMSEIQILGRGPVPYARTQNPEAAHPGSARAVPAGGAWLILEGLWKPSSLL